MKKEDIINIFFFYVLMINIGVIIGFGSSLFQLQQIENQQALEHLKGKTAAIFYDGDCVELGIPKHAHDEYGWGVLDGCIQRKTAERQLLATNHPKDEGEVKQ